MKTHRTSPAAYRFWLRLAHNLAGVEGVGVRVDKDYLDGAIKSVGAEVADLERRLTADKDFRFWRRRFGDKTNPGSYSQMKDVAYGDLGVESKNKTAGGRQAADKSSFERCKIPLVRTFFEIMTLRKALDTYLTGIRREAVQHADGLWYVHPSYGLNNAISFRSGCSLPSFQNQPKRNPRIAKIVRESYIPRPGWRLAEIDYGQIEVRVPCPYTGDPNLIRYVRDPATDMHYDMACQLFKLPRTKVSKAMRNSVKTWYVFASFYGDYWGQTSVNLWEDVDDQDGKPMMLEGGDKSLRQHLNEVGLSELGFDPHADDGSFPDPAPGTWGHHVRQIDGDFWGNRFKVYAECKRRWFDEYLREGGFTFLTGFAVHAAGLDKKQVANYRIQGSAFHLLGWALCELRDELTRRRMKSLVIGEIHDSMVLDLAPGEMDDVFALGQEIMTKRVVREFAPWMDAPLIAEPEAAPVDRSWNDLRAFKEADGGGYCPADLGKWEAAFGPWTA